MDINVNAFFDNTNNFTTFQLKFETAVHQEFCHFLFAIHAVHK